MCNFTSCGSSHFTGHDLDCRHQLRAHIYEEKKIQNYVRLTSNTIPSVGFVIV